ncbi:MAG: MFS transporter [Bacteroidales bacterium]|mgnify:CR=1 FL=1|nr:MFS transporter [Bacteroidales bacterium]
MKALINRRNYIPVLFTFFIMGFCDVVGMATSHLKEDFALSEVMAGFIPSMVFIWFLILSLPSALMMNRYGRKTMVQASNVITIAGMLIPFISYSFASCMTAFILLGIGNTILQVSLNPLLTDVVKGERLASCLTVGQVIKAVSSFCGPFIALAAVSVFGNWMYLFPTFAAVTMISWVLLLFTDIEESPVAGDGENGVFSTFGLLKDKTILLYFLGIFFLVGVDVGTNTLSPKLLIERCGFDVDKASLGSSVYFICRTAGAFLGSFLLARMNEIKYLRINTVLAVISIAVLFFAHNIPSILITIGGIGFFCSSIFSVLFSLALKARPDKANEISGFMITGVCGGAVIPPLMGVATDVIGNQTGSLIIITICLLYIVFCAFSAQSARQSIS